MARAGSILLVPELPTRRRGRAPAARGSLPRAAALLRAIPGPLRPPPRHAAVEALRRPPAARPEPFARFAPAVLSPPRPLQRKPAAGHAPPLEPVRLLRHALPRHPAGRRPLSPRLAAGPPPRRNRL